jgi:restriction system protein
MPVPTYDQFIEPVLRILAAQPSGMSAKDVYEKAAQRLGLNEQEMAELLPSGIQPVYKNRAAWAHDRLKRAGLSSSPKRGFWQLTPAGVSFISSHAAPLTKQQIQQVATDFMDVSLKKGEVKPLIMAGEAPGLSQSPDDRLETALQEIRSSVAGEVLELLAKVDPKYFESIVLDLLHKMGYGTNRSDLQRVGGSGDGGIDGIISLDRLGLEKVYVQAKRWQSSVGRPDVQGFYGALAGQRANKGVFITTSSFTQQAIDFARSVEKIVLVDGIRLAELMIDFEVGVSSRLVKIPKLDSDYFEE